MWEPEIKFNFWICKNDFNFLRVEAFRVGDEKVSVWKKWSPALQMAGQLPLARERWKWKGACCYILHKDRVCWQVINKRFTEFWSDFYLVSGYDSYPCAWELSCSVMSNSLWLRGLAQQAPLSLGSSRQEYWSGLPFLPSGDLPDPAIEPVPLVSLVPAGGFFTAEPPKKPNLYPYLLSKWDIRQLWFSVPNGAQFLFL